MTGFSEIILFIVAFYATINFIRLYSLTKRIFHFCLGISAVFLSLIGISWPLEGFFPVLSASFITDWSTIFSVSFLLSACAALIRDLKPVFSRFPRLFTFLPLLLIAVYPFIIDTGMFKDWLVALYQFGAIIICLLVFSYKTYENSDYGYLLVGIFIFFITFILYWLPESVFTLPRYAWILFVSSGVLIVTVGYNQVHQLEKSITDIYEKKENWFV